MNTLVELQGLETCFAIHEDKKENICSTCGARFNRKQGLQRHITEVHEKNEKVVVCHICSKTFTQARYLKAHTVTVHEGKKYNRKEKENKPIVE